MKVRKSFVSNSSSSSFIYSLYKNDRELFLKKFEDKLSNFERLSKEHIIDYLKKKLHGGGQFCNEQNDDLIEFDLDAGGTEPPYHFEDFLINEILDKDFDEMIVDVQFSS